MVPNLVLRQEWVLQSLCSANALSYTGTWQTSLHSLYCSQSTAITKTVMIMFGIRSVRCRKSCCIIRSLEAFCSIRIWYFSPLRDHPVLFSSQLLLLQGKNMSPEWHEPPYRTSICKVGWGVVSLSKAHHLLDAERRQKMINLCDWT